MRSGVRAEMLDAEFLGVFADSGDAGASLAGAFLAMRERRTASEFQSASKIVNSRAYIFVKISISFASVFLRLCSFIFQSTNVHLFFYTYFKFVPHF